MAERITTVLVDGQTFTGTVYNVRPNGWPCVETADGHCASGPEITLVGDSYEPCPICGAFGPDESCIENGRLIDDHAERP